MRQLFPRTGSRWRIAVPAVVAVVIGAVVWLLGPRTGLAVVTAGALIGAFVVVDWLRRRFAAIDSEANRRQHALEGRLTAARERDFAQLQALGNLYAMLPVQQRMPAGRVSWTASPDALLLLVSLVKEHRPTCVIDIGSGASTAWIAQAMRAYGIDGRVIALDHEQQFADATALALRSLGLDTIAEVRCAPLVELTLDGEKYPWYDLSLLEDVHSCQMLFVDGPPGVLRSQARYPAIPCLDDRLPAGSVVLVDDYDRPDERDMVAAWVDRRPGWSAREYPLEKGAAVLTKA